MEADGGQREQNAEGCPVESEVPGPPMKQPPGGQHDFTDGRARWDWHSYYPSEARRLMNVEAFTLLGMLVVSLTGTAICLGLADQEFWVNIGDAKLWISFRLLAIFCSGWVGAVTFSIKWLIHAAAKGTWHRDRRYWRLMVPAIGGVYACVVLTLFGSGILPNQAAQAASMAGAASLAFLVGYFSDGVSGLLSNVANAVFGTLEKK